MGKYETKPTHQCESDLNNADQIVFESEEFTDCDGSKYTLGWIFKEVGMKYGTCIIFCPFCGKKLKDS